MALSNAERQKKFRESNSQKLQELQTLRNEIDNLKTDNLALRNEINSLNLTIESLRNNQPQNNNFSSLHSTEPDLLPFKIPLTYCGTESFNLFTRRTETIWTYAPLGSSSNWKSHYQIHVYRDHLLLTQSANDRCKPIADFPDWPTMLSKIEDAISWSDSL